LRWGSLIRGAVGLTPSEDEPCVLVADKGYHARGQLKALEGGDGRHAAQKSTTSFFP